MPRKAYFDTDNAGVSVFFQIDFPSSGLTLTKSRTTAPRSPLALSALALLAPRRPEALTAAAFSASTRDCGCNLNLATSWLTLQALLIAAGFKNVRWPRSTGLMVELPAPSATPDTPINQVSAIRPELVLASLMRLTQAGSWRCSLSDSLSVEPDLRRSPGRWRVAKNSGSLANELGLLGPFYASSGMALRSVCPFGCAWSRRTMPTAAVESLESPAGQVGVQATGRLCRSRGAGLYCGGLVFSAMPDPESF